MAEQLQPTGAAAGLAALQRTASEVALLKKAVTPRLQAQGQNLVSQGRSIESRESELAHERRDLVTADSELLSIRVSSCATAPLQNRETQRVIRAHVATVGRGRRRAFRRRFSAARGVANHGSQVSALHLGPGKRCCRWAGPSAPSRGLQLQRSSCRRRTVCSPLLPRLRPSLPRCLALALTAGGASCLAECVDLQSNCAAFLAAGYDCSFDLTPMVSLKQCEASRLIV